MRDGIRRRDHLRKKEEKEKGEGTVKTTPISDPTTETLVLTRTTRVSAHCPSLQKPNGEPLST